MRKIVLLLSFVVALASCSSKTVDIKSPCVSTDDGPCGPKKPINDWWMKNSKTSKNSTHS